jgi:hypothetical protein
MATQNIPTSERAALEQISERLKALERFESVTVYHASWCHYAQNGRYARDGDCNCGATQRNERDLDSQRSTAIDAIRDIVKEVLHD